MKIAYLTPLYFDDASYIGGGERYPFNLAVGVADATAGGMTVEILSFGPTAFRRPVHPGVTLRVLEGGGRKNPLDATSWEMGEAVAGCDLLHVHQVFTRTAEIGYVLAGVFDKPVCVTDHGGWSSALARQFGGLHLVDEVICQSEFAVRMLNPPGPVTVLKGGVDGRAFRPPAARPPRDRVLFVGRLLPHKGVDQLIRAVPADLPLTVCGRPYQPEYHALLKTLAAGKRVEFVTDADDATVRDLYARAWATVLPSVYTDVYGETRPHPQLMGFSLLESMACGTPAVCPRVGGMPEFVRHAETGFVYDTLPELTACLTRLAAEPGLADRLGAAARQAVDDEFDMRACGRRLAAVYRRLDRRPAAGRAAA